jgi:hypothetical protein
MAPDYNVPDETSLVGSHELTTDSKQTIVDAIATPMAEVPTHPSHASHGVMKVTGKEGMNSSLSDSTNITIEPESEANQSKEAATERIIDEKEWSIWTPTEKKFIMFTASLAAFFSPVSGQIYFPALGTKFSSFVPFILCLLIMQLLTPQTL